MTPATYGLAVASLMLCLLLWDVQLRQLLFSVSFSVAGAADKSTQQADGPAGPMEVLLHQLAHTNSQEKPGAAAGVHGAIARLLDADGLSDAALHHYEAAANLAKISAADVPPALKLGDSILWAGKEKEESFDARTRLVEAYLARGSFAQAEKQANEQLDDLVGLDPSYVASAFRMAARVRCKVGNPKSALRLLKFARGRLEMTSDPEGADELVRVMLVAVEAHLQLGEISDAQQAVQQARAILCGSKGQAMQCGSTCPTNKPELQAELQQALGDVALASRNIYEATTCYNEALQLEVHVQPTRQQHVTKIKKILEGLQTGNELPASKSPLQKGAVEEFAAEDVLSI